LIDNIQKKLIKSVQDCLRKLGIKLGETVYLHSDAIIVGQFAGQGNQRGINIFIDAIEDYLGENGTLILPTYTYSFTKNEIYDVLKTPSCVGLITEIFRQRPGVMRSPEPIFSIAASGKNKNLYGECDPFECLGQGSSFEMLHKNSGWVVGTGCSFNQATFIHYVEKTLGVDYRYEKQFAGQRILRDGLLQNWKISYYVRDLSRKSDIELKKLQTVMIKNKTLKKVALGRVSTWAAISSDIFDTAAALLMEQSNSLIEEGN